MPGVVGGGRGSRIHHTAQRLSHGSHGNTANSAMEIGGGAIHGCRQDLVGHELQRWSQEALATVKLWQLTDSPGGVTVTTLKRSQCAIGRPPWAGILSPGRADGVGEQASL